MNQCDIRLAVTQDIAALIALDTVAVEENERVQHIRCWVRDHQCYVLVQSDVIVAYAVQHHHFFNQPFIELIMVDTQHRQQGYGFALIKYFQAQVDGKIFSSTNASNIIMQKLFIKSGFKPSGYIDQLDANDPELIYVYIV